MDRMERTDAAPLLDPRPYLANLPDPRRETRNKLHKLQDILMIVLCAIPSGVEDWVRTLPRRRKPGCGGFWRCPTGFPRTTPRATGWGGSTRWRSGWPSPPGRRRRCRIWSTSRGAWRAVRGSRDGANPAVHLVSAFAGRARWVLGQQAVAEKSNEITAIPDLLGLLDLRGAVVSIDAMGCQKAIAQTIVEAGGR